MIIRLVVLLDCQTFLLCWQVVLKCSLVAALCVCDSVIHQCIRAPKVTGTPGLEHTGTNFWRYLEILVRNVCPNTLHQRGNLFGNTGVKWQKNPDKGCCSNPFITTRRLCIAAYGSINTFLRPIEWGQGRKQTSCQFISENISPSVKPCIAHE